MGLYLNNQVGRVGAGGVQTVETVAVLGQSVVLELRVDGADAAAGSAFTLEKNGAPVTFDPEPTEVQVHGTDPLQFRAPGGFTAVGTHTLSIKDPGMIVRMRVEVRVVADAGSATAKPPYRFFGWLTKDRPGEVLHYGLAVMLALIMFGTGVLLPYWAYLELQVRYPCPPTCAATAAPVPAKAPDPLKNCCPAAAPTK